jgi:hypothetical protein
MSDDVALKQPQKTGQDMARFSPCSVCASIAASQSQNFDLKI